jgi:hypothetical protein
MLIGTLLMLSSRRVAVTTISCSALEEAPVSAGVASLAQAVVRPLDRMLQKSNNGRQIGAAGRERMAGIVSPSFYMTR